MRDGRAIGDVRWYELNHLAGESAREAYVLRALKQKFAFADDNAKIRDLIRPDELDRLIQQAAEADDANRRNP